MDVTQSSSRESLTPSSSFIFFFFNDTATTEIYTLSLHDALPIYPRSGPLPMIRTGILGSNRAAARITAAWFFCGVRRDTLRSEEHTSELQSRLHLVCRLLLEKKKKQTHSLEPVSFSDSNTDSQVL